MNMVIIKHEEKLKEMFKLVKTGNIRLLIVNGSGGAGKTTTAENELPVAMVIKGHLTPLKLYIDLFNQKPTYLIIDDVDELFKSKIMTSLLKQLTDTGINKTLSYASTHAKLNGIPRSFDASFIKGIVIITNDDLDKTSISTLKALMTRGLTVTYEPCLKEVGRIASTFAKKETLKYFHDFLITSNSLRDYKLIDNLLKANINVFEQLGTFSSLLSPNEQLITWLLQTHTRKESVKLSGLGVDVFNTLLSRCKAKKEDFLNKVREEVL